MRGQLPRHMKDSTNIPKPPPQLPPTPYILPSNTNIHQPDPGFTYILGVYDETPTRPIYTVHHTTPEKFKTKKINNRHETLFRVIMVPTSVQPINRTSYGTTRNFQHQCLSKQLKKQKYQGSKYNAWDTSRALIVRTG